MGIIRNRLNQRLIVNLAGGKNIELLARGTADVSGEELSSSHLQDLIAKGDISVVVTTEADGKETQVIRKKGKNKKQIK